MPMLKEGSRSPYRRIGGSGKAVALSYRNWMRAPLVAAKAKGRQAERLKAIAREAGLPFIRDGALAETLYALDIGEAIPPEVYEVVASIFAFVRSLEKG